LIVERLGKAIRREALRVFAQHIAAQIPRGAGLLHTPALLKARERPSSPSC
jgi:hypothetical protein